MDYNISDEELPTMVVRYENRLILRSVITGQHLEDLGIAPIWNDVPLNAAQLEQKQHLEAEHNKALEALLAFYPCVDLSELEVLMSQQNKTMQLQQQQQSKLASQLRAQSSRLTSPVNGTDLPPCKVQRNYSCNVCNYSTQNPRSYLLHQRHVHGIRLSIHCCQHCQYASRYFQKLKRHVKLVHTHRGSPRSSNGRHKRAANSNKIFQNPFAPKQITAEAKEPSLNSTTQKVAPPLTAATSAKPAPTTSSPKTTSTNILATTKPADFPNPEALFEAAYCHQLLQQQAQEQRLKKIANARKAVYEQKLESLKTSITNTSKLIMPPIKTNTPVLENFNTAGPIAPSSFNKSINKEINLINKETEKKLIYSCRKCNYMTHIKSRYNKHVKYHSMPMIQCDKCEFRTTYKCNLTRHLRSHHGNGLYKCSVCSFSAHMKKSLTLHELNHHSPPVGHASRNNKIYRRRHCRVAGSDLAVQTNVQITNANYLDVQHVEMPKDELINTEDKENQAARVVKESINLDMAAVESACSSFNSPTTESPDIERSYNVENIPLQQTALDVLEKCVKSEPLKSNTSNSLAVSYSSSPFSSNCSIYSAAFDNEKSMHEFNETLHFADQSQEITSQKIHSEVVQIKTSPTKDLQFTNSQLEDDLNISSDSDDSMITVSADETVPNGLHIAYDSSSPSLNKSGSNEFAANVDGISFNEYEY